MQNIETFEKAFYKDGFNLGMKAVEQGLEPKHIFAAIQEMYAAIDNLINSIYTLAEQQNENIDCEVGCKFCCHQPIFTLDYELDYLKTFLRDYFDSETLNEIQKNAAVKNNKFSSLMDKELLNAKHPCPLLNEGACMAYEVRPMACRIYLSSEVKTCQRFFEVPEDKNSFPALLDTPMRLGRMMNEGFKAALKTSGIVVEEFRIEEKLHD